LPNFGGIESRSAYEIYLISEFRGSKSKDAKALPLARKTSASAISEDREQALRLNENGANILYFEF
jgi:hypothetical protein